MNITLRIGSRARRAVTVTGAAALFAGLGLVAVAPGAVANGPGGQVCSGLDSTKIDVDDESGSLTIHAPEGKLIDGYCVKAGSTKQEDGGPEYKPVDPPAASVTISHSTGKGISHYSASYTTPTTTTTTEPPTSTTTTSTPPATTTTTEPPTSTTTTSTPPATTTTTEPPTSTTTTSTPPATTTTPPGNPNEECPDGTTTLAKYEWTGSGYVAEFGGDIVTSVTGDTTSATFTVAPGYVVTVVVVKGGTDVTFDEDGNLSFDNSGLENNGGQVPAISNVQFCGGDVPTSTTTSTPPATTTTTEPPTSTTTTSTPPATTTTTSTPPATTTTTEPPSGTTTTTEPPAGTTTTTEPPAGTTTTPATPASTVKPRVLARTGLEVSTVAAAAGLMLLGGGALLALASGTSPRGRRS